MRRALTFAALLLPLAGCYVEPAGGPVYAQPGYQPGPVQPAPYAYQDDGYPGYYYNDGAPYIVEEGVTLPLIFFGGAWG